MTITSVKPPTPSFASWLGLKKEAIIRVPYLTPRDVAEMVHAAGGDPQKWGGVIHAFAGTGHPQLVDARIAGLEQRGWDETEMLADVVPLDDHPNDMEEERTAVRNRLLQELSSNAIDLLLRLSLLIGNFDRSMVFVVAATPTEIASPGLHFDLLVGPWIEQVGPQRYRLSPLLKDSGTAAGLPASLQKSVRTNVMSHLIKERPFPADQLLQVFLIAFNHEDHVGLTWFAQAVMSASANPTKSQFQRLAQEISMIALIDRGEGILLVPNNPGLSKRLRYVQLRIALATDDMTQAAKLLDRALVENTSGDMRERQLFDALIAITVLWQPKLPVKPSTWLSMLFGLARSQVMSSVNKQPIPLGDPFSGLPPAVTYDELLFINRANSLKSADDLAELIHTLDLQSKDVRKRYIGAAARINQNLHLMVSASWLGEIKRDGFQARNAAATYRGLLQSLCATENGDLAVELLCAEAIILDEYADDAQEALEILRVGQNLYPTNYRLHRQRQKVFLRNNRHAEALAEFDKFQDRIPKEHTVDRAYAMREAGYSAATIGDLARARMFFGEAWEAARLCGNSMKPMTAGLSADCAIIDFDSGKYESALGLMRRALIETDDLDPNAGLREAFVKRVHLAAILYMRGAKPGFPVERQARIYGMCSDPEPQEWFRNQPQAQPTFAWYQLAELEAEISDSETILIELRKRTRTGGLFPLEITLASSITTAAMRDLVVDRFLEALKIYPRAATEGLRMLREGNVDLTNMPVGSLAPITEKEWNVADIAESARNAVISFMLACGAAGRPKVMADFRQKAVTMRGFGGLVEDLFSLADEPSDDETDLQIIVASMAGRLLRSEILDVNDVFISAIYALQFLQGSIFSSAVAPALMTFYEQLWPEILKQRTFSMRSPGTNGPTILAAMQRGETAMQRMASMVLASEAAAKRTLSDDLRNRFADLAAIHPKSRVLDD